MESGNKDKNFILKDNNPLINKIMFFNMKTLILTGILALIWIVVFIFFIWPKKHFHYMEGMNIASLGNLIIIVLVGVVAKLVYRNMTIKCRKCDFISKADKFYCGNCGESFIDDTWIKLKK